MIYRLSDNIISPLGDTTERNYQAIKSGQSALARYERKWNLPEPFTAALFADKQTDAFAINGMTRFESLAISSAQKAIEQAHIDQSRPNVVFILATTKGNVEALEVNKEVPRDYYPGNTAQRIAQYLGITTCPIVACNACISGVSAIVLALRLLDGGFYDYAVVCGADVQNKFTVSGFQSLKAVAEDDCRPFDIERIGLNLGEAASTIVFMSDRLALGEPKDDWHIECGFVRNDAFHISSPSKNGEGARLALSATHAFDVVDKLSFVNAHGTATMFNDQMESVAIERAGLNTVPVNALKGYYGHTMGAAGVLETIICMHSVDDKTILGTRGYSERGVSGKVQLSPNHLISDKEAFVKMISGFGGSNAAILVSKQILFEGGNHNLPTYQKTHHIVLTPDDLQIDGEHKSLTSYDGNVITAIYKDFIGDYPKFYKMDMLSRLAFVASELLLQAEGKSRDIPCEDRAVVLFNHSSSLQADTSYLATIADDEEFFPSPSVFVYTLPNIAVAEIAMRNHYHGETSFFILPNKDERLIKQVIDASFLDNGVESMITGWLDYEDNDNFVANLYIVKKTNIKISES